MSIVVLFIQLVLLIGLVLLISVAVRSLAKRSPVVVFSVLGAVFLLLLLLVLSILTLRYQSACRNLGSADSQRFQSAFFYLIRTKGIRQAFELALTRGSREMRMAIPHYIKETHEGKWAMLDGQERQRIDADQAWQVLARCLGDKDDGVATSAASYLLNSPVITPLNVQQIIPYLSRTFPSQNNVNLLWWIVKRHDLAQSVPDRVIAKGLDSEDVSSVIEVYRAKYCPDNDGTSIPAGAPRLMLLDMLDSPQRDTQAFACYRLRDIFQQALTAVPNAPSPLLGNRAFEKKLGIPGDQLRDKLQQFLRSPGKEESTARKLARDMLYDLTGKKQ